jgi:polar amino acid transport system substrate-binding protein
MFDSKLTRWLVLSVCCVLSSSVYATPSTTKHNKAALPKSSVRVVAPVLRVAAKPAATKQAKPATVPKTVPVVDRLQHILSSQTVRVCVRTDVPPFGFFQGRMLQGFDVALAQEIVTGLSIRFQKTLKLHWVVIRASGRVSGLQKGHCDMVLAAFSKTAARAKQVAFSHVYYKTRKAVLKKRGTLSPQPIIAMVRQTTKAPLQVKGAIVSTFYSYSDILHTMKQALVDYVVTDAPVGRWMVKQSGALYRLDRLLTQSEQYAVGVARGQVSWLREINRVLKQLERTGRLAFLHGKWL